MARSKVGRVRGWVVWPVLAACLLLVPVPPWAIESFYSRGVYPWLQNAVTSISNLIPVALLDGLIGVALLLTLFRVVRVWGLMRSAGVMPAVWDATRRLLRVTGVLIVVFLSAWGCNYRRVPLESSTGAPPTPTTAVLVSAVADANALAARLRPMLGDDADITYPEVAERLHTPMRAAFRALDRAPWFRDGRPKYSLLTPFFTWSGVSGMLNPFALESIVHPNLLPAERGFVLAHEWAHLAGQADEAEASALGWLACMNGAPVLAYSASLYLILEAGGALSGEVRSTAFAGLDDGVRADLRAIAERMQLQKPQVQRAAFRVYDEYLKANQVEDGTASYGRALTLILSPPLNEALRDYK